ncbi:hypothetical protein ACHAWF_018322 [Thalassiosira exigua]
MGGSLSTIRWTPYGPVPAGATDPSGRPLRKSKSYPPPHGAGGGASSPSNSTTNLSYEHDGSSETDDDLSSTHHVGTSGILMGANAPPLYDACLVGRWDDVLKICGVDNEGSGGSGGSGNDDSDDSPKTATTRCSTSDEGGAGDPGWPSDQRREIVVDARPSGDDGDDRSPPGGDRSSPRSQTRYADRRRNTPLHLACRRQPPPAVVRALLESSPCEGVSRRTADGLTPLHFAAYCGAGVEVVSLLVDRMRSDAAVGKAMRLSVTDEGGGGGGPGEGASPGAKGDDAGATSSSRGRSPSEDLPPTRLLDRRRRTPLHCALSGFRTPIRPAVVRKLLAADPASATLGDERGRTPLSLLFDDYAEEVMEALEDDVTPREARERVGTGGELHECWRMLRVLLQASYRGSVTEEEEGEGGADRREAPPQAHARVPSVIDEERAAPQAHERHRGEAKEVNVEEMYDPKHFSMVHAAAGVWECPAPLARLVLKCTCGGGGGDGGGAHSNAMDVSDRLEQLLNDDSYREEDDAYPVTTDIKEADNDEDNAEADADAIHRPDEETMRLPLHIAVCARPQSRDGHAARLKVWLSSPEARPARRVTRGDSLRSGSPPSHVDVGSVASRADESLATHPDRGRAAGGGARNSERVYNPRFSRSPSRDSVAAYSSSQRRKRSAPGRGALARTVSHSSISANIARERSFLQHTMVRDVLELYPEAASVVDDRTGKLPVVLAIEHGKSWETAVGPLLEAYPTPFGGGGDGGMALPDGSEEGKAHRAALQSALYVALCSPESHVREEAIRTAGELAEWGGVWGAEGSLDGIVGEWLETLRLDTLSKHGIGEFFDASDDPEGIVVGPGPTASTALSEWIQTQSSHLTAVAEVVSHSRPGSVSDSIARLCLEVSREYLFSRDGSVREAAARLLGNTLNSAGDAEDAANVAREAVLNVVDCESESVRSGGSNAADVDDVVARHGKLLACKSILMTQWGADLMASPDIRDGILAFLHTCIKDKNSVIRSVAYIAAGPVLGKGPVPEDPRATTSSTPTSNTLRELRSDVLRGTRASEEADVQLALARGLTLASRTRPGMFLCRSGMPILDAALMLAMSSSTSRPKVQKAFQIFLWVALQMGRTGGNEDGFRLEKDPGADREEGAGNPRGRSTGDGTDHMMSPGLERYIELAEGENGRIMMKFVTQTLAKIEDLDDEGGLC